MISGFLLSVLFSVLGIWVGVIGLIAAAIVVRMLGFPRWMVVSLIALAPVHAYSGWIWQSAMDQCERRVEREIRAERVRQEQVGKREVDKTEDRLDAAEKVIEDLRAQLAKDAVALPAPADDCKLSPSDADWINR